MRRITAHYLLRPDGTLGEFPIVEIDSDGVVLSVKERLEFEEEPFLEIHNGLLVPGFVCGVGAESLPKVKIQQLYHQGIRHVVGHDISKLPVNNTISFHKGVQSF